MPMQPSPIAETRGPPLPSRRVCMVAGIPLRRGGVNPARDGRVDAGRSAAAAPSAAEIDDECHDEGGGRGAEEPWEQRRGMAAGLDVGDDPLPGEYQCQYQQGG